jgi:ATP-dependent DNA helicase RecG
MWYISIINTCKEAQLPEPEIIEKDGGFQVTIFKDSVSGQVGGQIGGQVGDQVGGQVGTLTERQKEVLKLIVADPKISRRQLAEKLGINESAVQKHTNALKKKGIIERESDTTGLWTIKVNK